VTVSERTQAAAERIIARYPNPRSALLPLFYLAQHEHGAITKEGLAWAAEMVGVTRAEAQAVESYYEMYEHEDPGDWVITVCKNFSCKVRGALDILHRVEELLGGERDPEAGIAVKEMECLGNCDGAPVVQVNYNNYERCSVEQAEEIVAACRRGEPPPTVNGQRPPTFREVSWRLAGAADSDVLHEAAVTAVRADMVDYEEPPQERILDQDKPLGGPGVHLAGPAAPESEAGDIEPEYGPEDARVAREEMEQIPESEEQPLADRASEPGEPSGEDESERSGGEAAKESGPGSDEGGDA
jgi:NADH-quinone oxidoreductase subunit E